MTPTFTRRHYQLIADIIRQLPEPAKVAHQFVPTLQRDNPNFQADRFLRACTIIDLTKDPK